MNWKLTQLGNDSATAFAAEELHRYLQRMDSRARICRIRADRYSEQSIGALYIGTDPAFAALLPKVDDPKRDDAV